MIQMDQLQWALHCSDGDIFSREKGIWLFVKESNTGQGKSDLIASKTVFEKWPNFALSEQAGRQACHLLTSRNVSILSPLSSLFKKVCHVLLLLSLIKKIS